MVLLHHSYLGFPVPDTSLKADIILQKAQCTPFNRVTAVYSLTRSIKNAYNGGRTSKYGSGKLSDYVQIIGIRDGRVQPEP